VGPRLCRWCVGIAAGSRVRQRNLRLAQPAPPGRRPRAADWPTHCPWSLPGTTATEASSASPASNSPFSRCCPARRRALLALRRASEESPATRLPAGCGRIRNNDRRRAALDGEHNSRASDRPSLAVLPFDSLGRQSGETVTFADGMTDDIITDLAKLSGILVIARNFPAGPTRANP